MKLSVLYKTALSFEELLEAGTMFVKISFMNYGKRFNHPGEL